MVKPVGVLFMYQGAPVPKGRPRFRICKGHVMTFTPPKTKEFEKDFARAYQAEHKIMYDKELPLEVNLLFGMPIPKGTSKTMTQALQKGHKHLKRPDIDNLTKTVLDALNGVAWEDDSQIVKITAEKVYTKSPIVGLTIAIADLGGTT